MNEFVSLLILLLVLSLVLVSAQKIATVTAATGSVTIKADGSVVPGDSPIVRNGDVYTLTGGKRAGKPKPEPPATSSEVQS